MEWESPEDGVLTEIYVQEGGKVNVGDKIAFIGEPGEALSAKPAAKEEKTGQRRKKLRKQKSRPNRRPRNPKLRRRNPLPPKGKMRKRRRTAVEKAATERATKKPEPVAAKASTEEARVKASPVARRLAGELGVDLASVSGTGPEGRVTESDVRCGREIPAARRQQLRRRKLRLPQRPSLASALGSIFPECARSLPSAWSRAKARYRISI